MLTLGKYIGAVLAEVTNARVLADLESARIAQLYASHPLLAAMPIPRFRLPNVSLDLPFAVENVAPPPTAALFASEMETLRLNIDGVIDQELTQIELKLTADSKKRLTAALNRLFDRIKASDSLFAFDAIETSDEAVTTALAVIKATTPAARGMVPSTFESSLRSQFATEFLKVQSQPSRVMVQVVASKLKELASPQLLTRIRLTISEEGVEWTQTNPLDDSSKILLPE